MTTTQITDHSAQAIARLHEFHKDKTNILAFINAIIDPHQDIEDAMWQLFTERTIDTAIGQQLDDIGKIVGQPRNGLNDDDYRRHIRAKISVSQSNGRVLDVINVSRLIIDEALTAIEIDQIGAAAVEVILTGTLVTDAIVDFLIAFLRDTVAGGVRIILQHLQVAEANAFTMGAVTLLDGAAGATDTTLTVDSTVGFPDTGNLDLDIFGANPELDITYTSKTATAFVLATGLGFAHADDTHVEIAADNIKGYGAANLLNGAHSTSDTTVNYFDLDGDATSAFPATGSLILSPGLAAEETVTYTSRTATAFSGVSALVNNHLANAEITGSGGAFDRAVE